MGAERSALACGASPCSRSKVNLLIEPRTLSVDTNSNPLVSPVLQCDPKHDHSLTPTAHELWADTAAIARLVLEPSCQYFLNGLASPCGARQSVRYELPWSKAKPRSRHRQSARTKLASLGRWVSSTWRRREAKAAPWLHSIRPLASNLTTGNTTLIACLLSAFSRDSSSFRR